MISTTAKCKFQFYSKLGCRVFTVSTVVWLPLPTWSLRASLLELVDVLLVTEEFLENDLVGLGHHLVLDNKISDIYHFLKNERPDIAKNFACCCENSCKFECIILPLYWNTEALTNAPLERQLHGLQGGATHDHITPMKGDEKCIYLRVKIEDAFCSTVRKRLYL